MSIRSFQQSLSSSLQHFLLHPNNIKQSRMPFRTMDDLEMTSQEDIFQFFPTAPTSMSYPIKIKEDNPFQHSQDLASALDAIRILEDIINSKDNELTTKEGIYNIINNEQSEKLRVKERLLVAKDKIIEAKEKKLARLELEIIRLMEGDDGMGVVEKKHSGEKIQEEIKRKAGRKALKKEKTERKQIAKKLQIAGEKRAREDAMSDDELLSQSMKRVKMGRIRKSRRPAAATVEEA